jgi:pyruvate dehydrogenase E1 component alpha subunit
MWQQKDPIRKLERDLIEGRLIDEKELQVIRDEVIKEVREARAYAQRNPYPQAKEMTRYVFA